MSDTNQKKNVLEHRSIEDDLNALLQLAIKFESIQILIQPNVSHEGYKLWKEQSKENKVSTMEQKIDTSRQTFGGGTSSNRQIRRPQYRTEPRRFFRSNPNSKPRYPTRQFQRGQRRPQTQQYSRNGIQNRTDGYRKTQRNSNDYTYPARRSFGNQRYPYRGNENAQRNPNCLLYTSPSPRD